MGHGEPWEVCEQGVVAGQGGKESWRANVSWLQKETEARWGRVGTENHSSCLPTAVPLGSGVEASRNSGRGVLQWAFLGKQKEPGEEEEGTLLPKLEEHLV